jgi:photosystem II stability/assembly factor-like uncharacterized protein
MALLLGVRGDIGGSGGAVGAPLDPTAYGGPRNHTHALVTLRGVPQTLLLATHFGLYRSADGGQTWSEVAGGAGQVMDGLMIGALAQSPVEATHVYALAVRRLEDQASARDTPGIYMSEDAGSTWKLVTPATAFPSHTIFTLAVGSADAGQLYAFVQVPPDAGLYASDDAGAHWRALPALPTDTAVALAGSLVHGRRVFLPSLVAGLFFSDDGGAHWAASQGVSDGIVSLALAGPVIYAVGDNGVYVSHDDGATFTLASAAYSFSTVAVCASEPSHVYALGGASVYASGDGGRTWRQTAMTGGHPTAVSADPTNPAVVYVGLSYPLGMEKSDDGGVSWRTIL